MSEHLSPSTLNALVDGELQADQLSVVNGHLEVCSSCTRNALAQSLLKSATAKAGQRYAPPPDLQQRLTHLASEPRLQAAAPPSRPRGFMVLGWATVAVLLILVSMSLMFFRLPPRTTEVASSADMAMLNEVFDQHMGTLAGNSPPQVLSSDRHTVKPWFQGKLPFSFNLPEGLATDTTLDGANLDYLRDQPVAQLLYSIGKHRVSVFVLGRPGVTGPRELTVEHSGFHLRSVRTDDLEVVAVSDVDPVRLEELVDSIRRAQKRDLEQSR
jgi:anti-sigma factor RsiW